MIIAAAYHFQEGVCHFFERTTRRDFIEMGLHHLVSIFLILGAYFLESVPEGAAIAFLHDLADIFINLTRFSAETRHSKVTITLFVISMITWILTRLIWFPAFILAFYLHPQTEFNSTIIKPIICYLFLCLLVLHIYWLVLFFDIIYRYMKTGDDEDKVS